MAYRDGYIFINPMAIEKTTKEDVSRALAHEIAHAKTIRAIETPLTAFEKALSESANELFNRYN